MTFEYWKQGEQWSDHCNPTDFARAAWDYQQKKIDQLRAEIERMYKDRGLYSAWSNSNDV